MRNQNLGFIHKADLSIVDAIDKSNATIGKKK